MIREWTLSKLEAVKDIPKVIVRDSLRLLPEPDGLIHSFGLENGFTVIVAATNLVFRELYERAIADPETKKILVIDRAPIGRRTSPSISKAPPPFYPDLLVDIPEEAQIDLDLRQFLKYATGDPNWPSKANDFRFAKLIVQHLSGVIRAYRNLVTADPGRFNDHDFDAIVTYAVLGIPESAFKKLDAEDYWKIALIGHEYLQELESLAPEVTKTIRKELRGAPEPFCWFADRDVEQVIRAFYLALILSQHFNNWKPLIANVDPGLASLVNIESHILSEAAPKLVALDPTQAERDLKAVEDSFHKDALHFVLIEQLQLNSPAGFISAIEREGYSTLLRSLALLLALDDLLSNQPARPEHVRISDILFPEVGGGVARFVDTRPSIIWSHLKEAYKLASDLQPIRDELANSLKILKVINPGQLSFQLFWDYWNEKRINRLEYYLSGLERLIFSGDLLPRNEDNVPSIFGNALERIRQRIMVITDEVFRQLDELNRLFQGMVAAQYPSWIVKDTEIRLTSQFLRRCLKPHWDPQNEKAVVFIFDGMRYDIWDELLRPMFEDKLEVLADLPASSLLPSETHITRKAICAGTYPDEFDTKSGEDKLLKAGLAREFGYTGEVEVVIPQSAGTGEVVRYRAGNLEVYIFELCDKELHKIQMKTLPDGRQVPSRPLAFVYQQHLKNIIETEVMAIVRTLAPGTKVFLTADHGFGRIHRKRIGVEASWLNEPQDCAYLNAWLRNSLKEVKAPDKVRGNVWEFKVPHLRMPATAMAIDKATKQTWQKYFSTIIFPKTGYAFSRPNAKFNPDAYSHGGISIQELMIPMVVLRVKPPAEEGLLIVNAINGPTEAVEGEEVEFRIRLTRTGQDQCGELRVDLEAAYSREPDHRSLPHQILYVSAQGAEAVYRFQLDHPDATEEERRKGAMERTLTITVSYREGRRIYRELQTHRFIVRLNSEQVIRRVPSHLGNILGLTPKSMK